MATCRHCHKKRANQRRHLCSRCYASLRIRALYPPGCDGYGHGAGAIVAPGGDVHAALAQEWEKHPLWVPVPYTVDDPRYNVVVAAREEAGLPGRHPGDA